MALGVRTVIGALCIGMVLRSVFFRGFSRFGQLIEKPREIASLHKNLVAGVVLVFQSGSERKNAVSPAHVDYSHCRSRGCSLEETLFSCKLRTLYHAKRDANNCINK